MNCRNENTHIKHIRMIGQFLGQHTVRFTTRRHASLRRAHNDRVRSVLHSYTQTHTHTHTRRPTHYSISINITHTRTNTKTPRPLGYELRLDVASAGTSSRTSQQPRSVKCLAVSAHAPVVMYLSTTHVKGILTYTHQGLLRQQPHRKVYKESFHYSFRAITY